MTVAEWKGSIREFLREELLVETRFEREFGPDFTQSVSLRFKGEEKPFAEATIIIPLPPDED